MGTGPAHPPPLRAGARGCPETPNIPSPAEAQALPRSPTAGGRYNPPLSPFPRTLPPPVSPSSAPLVSRYTYRLHAQAAVLEGILAGVLVTYDVVARKTLGASQFQLVILTMAPGSSWLLSLFFANQFQGYDRRSLFLWAGLIGRLPLFAVAWMHGVWPFLAVLVLHGFVQTALIPAQNALYQQNYDAQSRGRLFGRASVWGCAATAVTALGSGLLMDMKPVSSDWPDWLGWLVGPDAFRWLYPAAGIAGLGACLVYGSIRLRKSGRSAPHAPIEAAAMRYWPPHEVVLPPFRRAFEAIRTTLIQDAGFRRFEVALFVYGLGFMVMQPVFAVLFVDELHMKYSDASLAKGVVFYVVNVAALAAAGRMYDRLGLERLGARATVLLAVFATAMAFVQTPAQAVAAFSRSEEHTSELQSQSNLVCRLLLEKKKKKKKTKLI